MSDIDFQNGFIAGMATRGITRSGLMYQPHAWNDSGVYSYFYIDFKKPVDAFSTGMFNQSVIVFDSVQLIPTAIDLISPGLYKVWCDISLRYHGITVINKANTLLQFSSGGKVPVFSTRFMVEGVVNYIDADYCYDSCTIGIVEQLSEQIVETVSPLELSESFDAEAVSDVCAFTFIHSGLSISETVSVVLT